MLSIKEKSTWLFDIGQFGTNQTIVDSADVNLKSASFRYFADHRDVWELNDHYESPGPIQFYGDNSNYIPLSLTLEDKYDFILIEKIEKSLT